MPRKPTIGRARGRPRSSDHDAQASTIQSLDRAMAVLKVVATGGGLSLTEIAAEAAVSAATVYRILITLQKHRMVEFEDPGQLWHIGLDAFRIGNHFLNRTSVVEQSRPVMQRLMASTGETSNLAVVDHDEVIFVSQAETHEPIRAFFRPGTRGPVHAAGVGKAMLAFLPKVKIEAILKGLRLRAFTEKTIVTKADLLAELEKIRVRGWAIDDEERTMGMRCIAAPIFNQFGEAIAGLSLSGPSVRVSPDRDTEFGLLVLAAADEITQSIGGKRRPASKSG